MEGIEDGESVKKNKWAETLEILDKVSDKLGKGIDPGIKDAVAALNIHSLTTSQSCEGHIEEGQPYPWVDVGGFLYDDARFQELQKKHIQAQEENEEPLSDEEEGERKEKLAQQKEKNLAEIQRLQALLDEFYSESIPAGGVKLVVEVGGWNSGRLQSEGVPTEEMLERRAHEDLEPSLRAYQAEMNRFKDFLKERFFRD